mgnify:CR=1 FL=1
MNIRWLRIILAGVIAEIVPIVILVIVVATMGPGEPEADQEFAKRFGMYIGPIAGAVAAFVFAIWVARPLSDKLVLHGFLLGAFIALLDAALLVAGSSEFQWIIVFSGLGRIVAGTLGGFVATRAGLRMPDSGKA